jgi:hypothetical protein
MTSRPCRPGSPAGRAARAPCGCTCPSMPRGSSRGSVAAEAIRCHIEGRGHRSKGHQQAAEREGQGRVAPVEDDVVVAVGEDVVVVQVVVLDGHGDAAAGELVAPPGEPRLQRLELLSGTDLDAVEQSGQHIRQLGRRLVLDPGKASVLHVPLQLGVLRQHPLPVPQVLVAAVQVAQGRTTVGQQHPATGDVQRERLEDVRCVVHVERSQQACLVRRPLATRLEPDEPLTGRDPQQRRPGAELGLGHLAGRLRTVARGPGERLLAPHGGAPAVHRPDPSTPDATGATARSGSGRAAPALMRRARPSKRTRPSPPPGVTASRPRRCGRA